jgi:hypothetical protein
VKAITFKGGFIMTCIVGIETPKGVMLAADSMGGEGTYWTAMTSAEPKVFRLGAYVLGFTTSFRMGDLLRYHAALPAPPARGPLHRHMVLKVVPVLRSVLKDHGFATTKEGGEVGGDFLIGVRGALFHVQSNYAVQRATFGYDAAGCGAQSALGALSCAKGEPRARLRAALVAAERHNMGVRGPWSFATERP